MSKEINKDLCRVWNAVYSEIYEYKQQKVGELLTIIDAVIPDDKQNKSVKDLIKKSIWEDNRMDNRIAETFLWFDRVTSIADSDCDESIPYKYDGSDRNPNLEAYNKLNK